MYRYRYSQNHQKSTMMASKKRPLAEWRVYPPKKKQYVYQDGDSVIVKSKDGKSISKGIVFEQHDNKNNENDVVTTLTPKKEKERCENAPQRSKNGSKQATNRF